MRAVLASGYRGPLSLEVFNDHFRAAPARMIARDGLRSLIFAEAAATGPAALPAAPDVGGIAFLEFAVDDAAREALAGVLAGLGFHLAGRHRSKAVEMYRQGDICFVLNIEQDSAASEHFQHHGPSVCAMALWVDDPARALARTQALLIPQWRERVGAGERAIPAVRGPDGTLIYLVGRDAPGADFWHADFHLIDAPGEGARAERDRPPGSRAAGGSAGHLRPVLAFAVRPFAAARVGSAGPVRADPEPRDDQRARHAAPHLQHLRRARHRH